MNVDDGPGLQDDKPRSRYVSLKDVKIVSIVLVPLIALGVWLYLGGLGKSEEAYCRQNLRQIGVAMLSYSALNDDRLPPAYNVYDRGQKPIPKSANGRIINWGTVIQPYMSTRNTYLCRSAKPEEAWTAASGLQGETPIQGTYGMYRGLSSTPRNQITSPNGTILVAESVNLGFGNTFNPVPFSDMADDGSLLGWDDGNIDFTPRTKWVTRLAFFGADAGYASTGVKGRHGGHIDAVTVEGGLRVLGPMEAAVEHASPRLKGLWWSDPNYTR